MDNNFRALKTWAGLAAALIPLTAACAGPDTNTLSAGVWEIPSTNHLESLQGVTTVKTGGLGLVISGSPEGAVVERVVIGGLAWQAGVRGGDTIEGVNGRLLLRLGLPRIERLLRELPGSEIELTLRRPGQSGLLKLRVKRAQPSPEVIP